MKSLILPNRELQLLSNQIQNFNRGYTVAEIRILDKVVRSIELALSPFMLELKSVADQTYKTPQDKDEALNKLMETVGQDKTTVTLEDTDFEFVKNVWSKMAGLSGVGVARNAIIVMDDAIKNAAEPVFKK